MVALHIKITVGASDPNAKVGVQTLRTKTTNANVEGFLNDD